MCPSHAQIRRYELRIRPRAQEKCMKLRAIKAKHVGALVSVKGIVTRYVDAHGACVWIGSACMHGIARLSRVCCDCVAQRMCCHWCVS